MERSEKSKRSSDEFLKRQFDTTLRSAAVMFQLRGAFMSIYWAGATQLLL